jgi:hypothetical protein
MVAKLIILTHKISIQVQLFAESSTIGSFRSRWPVRKLLDTPSYYGNTNSCPDGRVLCPDMRMQIVWLNYLFSTDYGEPCDHDDDCYGGYSYESLSCVGKKCNCSQAYYLIGRSDCRRKGNGER